MKTQFKIKTREQVTTADQSIFDSSTKALGFVPNMYGVLAISETALSTYVKAEFSKSTLNLKEIEVVNLAVSQANNCDYCMSFHYGYLQKLGFTEDQLLEIRKGSASFDPKLDALIKLSQTLVEKRGHVEGILIDNVISVGYTPATVIDLILLVNLRSVTNYTHAALGFEIDFPIIPALINY